jgi:hypothetical protein
MLFLSLMINVCLTGLLLNRPGTCCRAYWTVITYEVYYEQQLKNTPGITGLYNLIALIDNYVWHLDVDLSFPNIEDDIKGLAVR